MNENNSWLIVPIMMMGVVVVSITAALLLEFLPRQTMPIVFVAGAVLTTFAVTAVIMAIAITQLGCC